MLVPTRELAKQVAEEFSNSGPDFTTLVVHGGTSYQPQIHGLRRGTDIVVGTPGRILDLMESKHLDLSSLDVFVMDEADYMLDLGFLKDMEKILGAIRQSGNGRAHQTLLFSATLPDWVAQTSKTFMTKDKVTIDLVGEADSKVANTITHYAMPSPLAERNDTIRDAIEQFGKESSTLVFVERRTDAAGVVTALGQTMRVAALHGDVSQAGRDAILNNFKSGSLQCVVTTDVAARSL